MRKVLVIGPSGAGKSTFATRLGKLLEIEVQHLDRFYWRRGWVKPSGDEWLKTVEGLLSRDSWIIDGNYSGTLERRLEICDTVIFLDMPRTLCLWRIFKRLLLYNQGSRPDMADGCPERVDLEFILWVWSYSRRTRPKIVKLLRTNSANKRVVWLRSRVEVERFLNA